MGLRIRGWGVALPDQVVTNQDLEKTLDTSDEWIVDRTGIRERRIGGTTASLAIDAGRAALDCAAIEPASIELMILATTTPDQVDQAMDILRDAIEAVSAKRRPN